MRTHFYNLLVEGKDSILFIGDLLERQRKDKRYFVQPEGDMVSNI